MITLPITVLSFVLLSAVVLIVKKERLIIVIPDADKNLMISEDSRITKDPAKAKWFIQRN